MNTSLIWPIATVLIPLLFPVAIALAASLYMSLMQRLPMQQRLIVSSLAHTVVRAVEQMLPDDAPGAQKKDQALQALVSIVQGVGLKVPSPLLETALESAVFELHTMYPHSDQADPGLSEPFPYRPTLRSLPVVLPSSPSDAKRSPARGVDGLNTEVQLGTDPSAPTQPIPLNTDKRPS